MTYGAISNDHSLPHDQEKQVFKSHNNGQNGLKIFAIVLIVTLVGLAGVAFFGSSEGPNSGAVLMAESPTIRQRESRFTSRNSSNPIVTIADGKLNGVVLKSRAGRDYYGFYKVPYGKPPIGNLRFKPPEPSVSWNGTRDATVKGPKCIQQAVKTNPNNTEGSEDCLHTNIYTPKIPRRFRKPKLPVIVYFFGGAFMHGTANDFSAEYFMDEEVVIVIVESRVGALGYLNTGDLEATGNQGLKDQNLALKWVQKNIAGFGGDPKRVVAFGTSSGAMGAHAHLLSPMTTGLVTGIMSLSGIMLAPDSIPENPRALAEDLGRALKCPDLENSTALLVCLRNATPHEIAQNQPTFGPSVEAIPANGDLSSVFLPDTPLNLLQSGRVNKIPWITGVNSAEAILMSYQFLLDPKQVGFLNNNWDDTVRTMLKFGNDTKSTEIIHKLRQFYFGDKPVSNETRYNLTNLLSDRNWVHPTKTSAMLQAEQSPVYTYYLTKEANLSWAAAVTQYFDPPYGVSHADEVQYFFLRPGYPHIPLDSPWADFSKMIVKLWVSFAETGAPVGPVDWPPIPKNWTGVSWYNLDDQPKMVEPIRERMELWNSFPINLLY